MTENTENLILEHLRAIRADIADLKERMAGVEVAITRLGQQMAGLTTAVYSGGHTRMDDFERRLELRDAD